MIFVTTGTQLPFPRLIGALNELAVTLNEPVIAQIGPDPALYPHLETHARLDAQVFERQFSAARVIVAHAGIGTILTAKRYRKPLILLPRRHDLGEHRNDHQLATATHMKDHAGLHIAWHEGDLAPLLWRAILEPMQPDPGTDLARLTDFIGRWIAGGNCGG